MSVSKITGEGGGGDPVSRGIYVPEQVTLLTERGHWVNETPSENYGPGSFGEIDLSLCIPWGKRYLPLDPPSGRAPVIERAFNSTGSVSSDAWECYLWTPKSKDIMITCCHTQRGLCLRVQGYLNVRNTRFASI